MGDYNFAKFINHSCNPNCEVDIIDNEIWISSIKRIKKGAELFYNYGYPFDTDFVDHICKCGSRNCVGYILSDNDWPKLKKNSKRIEVSFKNRLVSKHNELIKQFQQILLIQKSFLENLFQLMERHNEVCNLCSL